MCVCVNCIISDSTDTQTYMNERSEINTVSLLPAQELSSGLPSGLH